MLPQPVDALCPNILLVMPTRSSAEALQRILEKLGWSITAVHNSAQLKEALMLRPYDLAVTSTVLIGMIRRISSLTIVNFEVFVPFGGDPDANLFGAGRFDTQAFVRRITWLMQQPTHLEPSDGKSTQSGAVSLRA